MSKSIEHQDFDRHYPAVLEFQALVRQAARRALRTAEHAVEREAIRSALVRAGNLRTVAAKLYTDGPAQPAFIRARRKWYRKTGRIFHVVAVVDIDGDVMWTSPATEGSDYMATAWKWLVEQGYVPAESFPSQHNQYGISGICGQVSGRAKL